MITPQEKYSNRFAADAGDMGEQAIASVGLSLIYAKDGALATASDLCTVARAEAKLAAAYAFIARPELREAALTDADAHRRSIERSLAYERATGVIESHCMMENGTGDLDHIDWYDLDNSSLEDLSQEVDYLTDRRLLLRHPDHASWVTFLDEDEPQPLGMALVAQL